jgi:hypothetical protein
MQLLTSALGALLGTFLAWWLFMRRERPPWPARCDALVVLRLRDGKPVAKPYCVCLRLGRELFWEVEGALGDEVTVQFEEQRGRRGPFRHDTNNPFNPERGIYRLQMPADGRQELRSNPAEEIGLWTYDIVWTRRDQPAVRVDPEVCISI